MVFCHLSETDFRKLRFTAHCFLLYLSSLCIFLLTFLSQHGMSALHFAANAGHLEILNLLLAAGADVNAVDEV